MKSKSKIVLTGAVAGAMAMGAVTGVIFESSAHAEDGAAAATVSATSGGSSTSTNNDASAGILASSTTSNPRDFGGSTLNATSSDAPNLNTEQGADTDARMRQAESRQSGSRGALTDNAGLAADGSNSTGGSIDTTLPATVSDDVDPEAAAETQADTDARLREAESRQSGSRGSLSSDTTAGADQNAELRDQIRNDPSAEINITGDTDKTDTPRSGGLLGMLRGNVSATTTNGGTQIGAGGDLQ